jgi:aspartyl-tRNA(Asn)/glutamyl-tRNA(Gln) amidotransferase subunit A
MLDLQNTPYHEIRKLLLQKELSVKEVVQNSLALAEKDKLNSFREVTADYALQQAEVIQQKIDDNTAGLLAGLTLAVKDNYCNKGVKTTACSRILENFVPAYESTVTAKSFAAGAIMIGKANMDEFAMGSSNTNSYFGDVINPWKEKGSSENLVAGGSSGGSAVAVAAKICAGALGTDTGGSVRLPAAFTGVIGAKPTYGRCSRYGIIAFASSFDQTGVFANNITDTAMILQSICGVDKNDSTSKDIATPDLLNALGKGIKGMKIGVPKEYLEGDIADEIKEHMQSVCNVLRDAGAEIKEVSLPNTKHALASYYIITSAEMSSNLSRYDGVRYSSRISGDGLSFAEMVKKTRSECLGTEVKNRIMVGTYVLSASHFGDYFEHAKKVRRIIYNEFKEVFNDVDTILTPTSKSTAFPISAVNDPIAMYNNDIFTVPSSLAGVPAVSVPVGLDRKGLPIGLQVISKHFAEEDMFKVAYIIEKNTKI